MDINTTEVTTARTIQIPKDMTVGSVHKTNEGGKAIVVEYINSFNVVVMFQGYDATDTVTVQTSALRAGSVKNPMHPSMRGVGYIGIGDYVSRCETLDGSIGQPAPVYRAWGSMMNRAYSQEFKTEHPTYTNVTVCSEWHNFQTFAAWYCRQHGMNPEATDYHLDKDLLVKGNRIYSPSTCCLIPAAINAMVHSLIHVDLDSDDTYGLPHGVQQCAEGFYVKVSMNGQAHYLHGFKTPHSASRAYKALRIVAIQELLDQYALCSRAAAALRSTIQ